MAQLGADYGDLRGLEDLGIDLSALRAAQEAATGGSPTGNPGDGDESGGDDGSGPEGGNPELTAEQSTANADELLAYIRRVPGLTNENRAALIVQAINNGRISESDAQRIASILGIDV